MTFVFISAFATVLGLSAVCALSWCFRSGQMQDFRAGARSIFDDDEPNGEVTDHFPIDESSRGMGGKDPPGRPQVSSAQGRPYRSGQWPGQETGPQLSFRIT